MTDVIRVFLVDDHAVVRRGLASYLDGEDDLEVIGQAGNGRRALDEIAVVASTPDGLPDNGRGFDPTTPRPGHLGLMTMRERTAQIGADLQLTTAPGSGTTVRLTMPSPAAR